ncbi:MAG TPA: ArdC family protein [Saprospiraceae bacterium]|nr:ArdC family protein [Saprospiraceae bacterium]
MWYNKKESGEKERVSTYELVTQKIIERMEQGEIPWKKPWKAQPPRNLITHKPYHGVNFLLLGSQDYPSPYWLTFKQAQERGGHVRKGEKGSMVTFWKILEKDLKEENKEI